MRGENRLPALLAFGLANEVFTQQDFTATGAMDAKRSLKLFGNAHALRKIEPTGELSGRRKYYRLTQLGRQQAMEQAQQALTAASAPAPAISTPPMPNVAYDVLARAAVVKLRDKLLSSVQLAAACSCSPAQIDTALAPLVDAHKLTRVTVMREGIKMFDYRYSAAWVPASEDFNFTTGGTAPVAELSPAPERRPVPWEANNPKTPWRQSTTGRSAGATAAVAAPAGQPSTTWTAPQMLNLPVVEMSQGQETATLLKVKATGFPPLLPEFSEALKASADEPTPQAAGTAPQAYGWAAAEPSQTLVADDLVCAINSRGEFVLDLGGDQIVRFPPAQALVLKRFLDNTSVLEELAAGGAL